MDCRHAVLIPRMARIFKACSRLIFLLSVIRMQYLQASDALNIQVGDLATVRTADALAFMGGTSMNKGKWLQLGNTSVHPEAFLRFMVLGSPPVDVTPNVSWGPQEDSQAAHEGGLLATNNASIADYRSHLANSDLGKLEIKAWMLAFACVDSESPCRSFAPVAIANRVDEKSGSTCLEFTIAWDKLVLGSGTVVTNTIAAKLGAVGKEERIIEQGAVDGAQVDKFSIKVVNQNMEACPNTSVIVAVRSSLDATYNLGPYACYRMNSSFIKIARSEYLLVLGMQYANASDNDQAVEGNGSAETITYGDYGASSFATSDPTQNCIDRWLQNFQRVGLKECLGSPLLIANSPDGQFAACQNASSSTCLLINPNKMPFEADDECNDMMFQDFNASLNVVTANNLMYQSMNVSGFNYLPGSSVYGLPTGNLCEAAGNIQNAGQSSSFLARPFGYTNNPVAVDADVLGALFAALNNQYAQAHSQALQLQEGSSTDFPTAMVALVGAAISVLAATIPLANFFLRLLVKVSGTLHRFRYQKIILVCSVNMGLAVLCYGAVAGIIKSEKQRAQAFKTWALIAESVVVNEMGLQLQALYVVQGASIYKSRLIAAMWILLSVLVVFVGGMTFWRCCDVLNKLQLIKVSNPASVSLSSDSALLDDYNAIEMGTVQYLQLQHSHQPIIATAHSTSNESAADPQLQEEGQGLIVSPAATAQAGKFKQVATVIWFLQGLSKETSNPQ